MVDHIRTLLLNPSDVTGYRHVTDVPADTALRLFGVAGDCNDEAVVDLILPLAMSDDLSKLRRFFDARVSPKDDSGSVYRHEYSHCGGCGTCASMSMDGVYEAVLGSEGWWTIAGLFRSGDPSVMANLSDMHDAARSRDSAYALGAVLLACAYRRLVLQEEA